MHWHDSLRIVAPVVVAIGLTGTVQLAASESERAETVQANEEAHIVSDFGVDVDGLVADVRGEAERVDVVAETLLAAEGTEFDDVVEALDVFEGGPSIVAVELVDGSERQLALPEGSLAATEVPGSLAGITATTEGRWANTLTYRTFDGPSDDPRIVRSVAVVVDLEALLSSLDRSTFDSVAITGITGMPSSPAPNPSLLAVGSDIFVEPSSRQLSTGRPIEVLGEPATLHAASPAGALVAPESNEVKLLISIGLLLTAVLGAITWFATRLLTERLSTRDHEAQAREAAIARFRASFTNAPMGVVEVDADGDILAVNPRFASKLGYLPEELLGTYLFDLVDGADRQSALDIAAAMRADGATSEQAERRYRTRNGSAVWMKESISAIDSADGTQHLLVQVEDISDERRNRAELRRRALYDELTGLPNRSHLISQLRLAVDTAGATDEELAVMFVDLNKFKVINDTLGHDAGDQILIEVAERLRSACRAGDTIARLGGDEFVIVCQGVNDEVVASQAADRYFDVLNQPTEIDGNEVEISASIGLVVAGGNVEPEELLRNADRAMYQAKASDSGAVVEFDYSMKAETVDRLSQEVGLRKAVENGDFELHFQTIVDTATLDVVGVEALVRWNHPTNGLLAPGEFLPLADEIGVLEDIDRWALLKGIDTLASWTDHEVAASWFLTVNTGASHFADPDFADWVLDLLVDSGIDPRRLVLERPERTAYADDLSGRGTTRELRSRGVRISLDHFGVGRTSLSELSGLEIDAFKIGRSLISNASSREVAVFKAIADMAKGLGVQVLAEGIESQAELDLAIEAGIGLAQGYHFSRPVDAETIEANVLEHRAHHAALGSSAITS